MPVYQENLATLVGCNCVRLNAHIESRYTGRSLRVHEITIRVGKLGVVLIGIGRYHQGICECKAWTHWLETLHNWTSLA